VNYSFNKLYFLLKVVPPKVIESFLQICYRGAFEKPELAVKVRLDTHTVYRVRPGASSA